MFPKIVEDFSNGNRVDAQKTVKNTLKITIFVCGVLTALMAIFPNATTNLFFGSQYHIGSLLSIYVIATFFLCVASILMMYDLAVKRYDFIVVFSALAIILVYQITQLHQSLYQVAWTLFVIDLIVLLFMLGYNKKMLTEKVF
jgi:O-antigen/teichoic acid export membrane protein